jgi:integrase/recombinase XerD
LLEAGRLSETEYQRIVKLYPKKSPYYQPKQRVIYAEDLSILLDKASKGHSRYQAALNVALLVFLSETGLRVSELCAMALGSLCFSPVPQDARVFVIKGKGGKNRTVPFSKAAQEAVQEYLAVCPKTLPSPLFHSFNPKRGYTPLTRDCVARRFKQLADDTGVDFSAHTLRHYRITQWANNPRIPITVTQKWAGHSSLEVTQWYIHIRDEEALG